MPSYGYRFGPGGFNTGMAQAQATGDQRANLKPLDRAGLSRGGAAQQAAASRGGAQMAQGIADAYGRQVATASDLSNMALQGQMRQEQMAQALAALQSRQQMGILQGLL